MSEDHQTGDYQWVRELVQVIVSFWKFILSVVVGIVVVILPVLMGFAWLHTALNGVLPDVAVGVVLFVIAATVIIPLYLLMAKIVLEVYVRLLGGVPL